MAGARRLEDEIRIGLEQSVGVASPSEPLHKSDDPLEQISFGKPVRRHVRDFGVLFAVICFGLSAWQAYKGKPASTFALWIIPGVLFGALGLYAPRVLHPVWRVWMKFAHYLSIAMTFVLLVLTWSIGFIPMAVMLKICKVGRIDLTYGGQRPTYWEERNPKYDDFKRLELQY